MTLRALIFDVDGTLAETEELHRRAFNDAFRAAGLNWHWDRRLYKKLLKTTGGKERMAAFQRDHEVHERPISKEQIAALHLDKTARYTVLLEKGALDLRPGVAQLIEDARDAGLAIAVATTTSLPNVEALCRCCWRRPATGVFDVIAGGDEVAAKKPAPDVFQLALRRLGLAPEDCLAFEDSRNGMLSAAGAGLRVHIVPSMYTEDEDFTGAAEIWPQAPKLGAVS